MNKFIIVILVFSLLCLNSCLKVGTKTDEQIKSSPPNKDLSLIKSKANFKIPLLNLENIWVYQKEIKFPFPNSTDSSFVKVIYTENGNFLRLETLKKIKNDNWRVPVKDIEKDMRNGSHWGAVTGLPPNELDFDFQKFLVQLSRKIPNLTQAKEFNLNLVQFKTRDGKEQPILIFNVWGMENPLGIRRPEILKNPIAANRIRYILTLEGEIIGMDNRL